MSAIHVYFGPDALEAPPVVRKIGMSDAFGALKEGLDDFLAAPTHLAFLAVFYIAAGMALTAWSSFGGALHLVFPLAAGFALVGPFVAIGLYELSRRREEGRQVKITDAFIVANSPALPSIAALGLVLLAIFAAWIGSAEALYMRLYGAKAPPSAYGFLVDLFTSERGHWLIGLGGAIGFVYAALVLAATNVAFPLMLERDVGLVPAVATSLRVSMKNPLAVATWGAIVAALLIAGALPLFIGLAIAMPVLGHGTWRFYRRAVEPDPAHAQRLSWPKDPSKPARYHTTPHSLIFPQKQADER